MNNRRESMRNVLSLGGGVQSTALFLMALHGDFEEKVASAIFADPGAEHAETYDTIEFLREYASGFGVPIYTVSAGNLREYSLGQGTDIPVAIPFSIKHLSNI